MNELERAEELLKKALFALDNSCNYPELVDEIRRFFKDCDEGAYREE